jgi:hypothetical protein
MTMLITRADITRDILRRKGTMIRFHCRLQNSLKG